MSVLEIIDLDENKNFNNIKKFILQNDRYGKIIIHVGDDVLACYNDKRILVFNVDTVPNFLVPFFNHYYIHKLVILDRNDKFIRKFDEKWMDLEIRK